MTSPNHPYLMLAGALGVGFVLGGGLSTRLASGLVAAGLRAGLTAALPVVQQQLVLALTTYLKPQEGQ